MTAKKPAALAGAETLARERQALAAKLLAKIPEATLSWKFGNASLDIDGKVFAFTGREGRVAMKLPEERIAKLTATGKLTPLVMGKRTMREWAVAPDVDSPLAGRLLGEALEFVRSLSNAKRTTKRVSKKAGK